MSNDATLNFQVKQVLYGSSNTVVVNSSTNIAKYEKFLSAVSGSEWTAIDVAYSFSSQTKLTYKVVASYNTVDAVLSLW
jgi:hypothetical protein